VTGPEHYQEAERLLQPRTVASMSSRESYQSSPTTDMILQAEVHATLALAAAFAMGADGSMADVDFDAWDKVCGVQVASP
jgi:hypothetical protein